MLVLEVGLTMPAIRQAISTIGKEERMKVAIELNVLDQVGEHWNGGKICAQCQHYTQLGGRGSGLNGVCSKLVTNAYIQPETPCCQSFLREVG